jgi:MFS family permease
MGICAVAMVGLALAQGLGFVVVALILSSLGAGICFAPAMTSLSEAADSSRLHQGFAAGLSNMAWSAGQVSGSLAGGAIASAAGFAVPSLAVAALLVFTAGYAYRDLSPTAVRPA